MRANLGPALALQAAALALVVGYYRYPWLQAEMGRLSELHKETGFVYALISTGLFGGFLPFLFLRYGPKGPDGDPHYDWRQGIALTVFWAYKGFEVDLWYRIQAHGVGTGHGPATIAIKSFLDQFVYCPLYAVPVTTAAFQAIESHFDWSALKADIRGRGWYGRRVLPVLIANLAVWLPAVAIIYALPTSLQLPLQNLVLCFFTLIVAHQTRDGGTG